MFLIGQGELSSGVALLTSKGLGDLGNARVVDQLRRKHPGRKEPLPESLDAFGMFPRVQVELRPTIEQLRDHAGTGASGFRNEYLKALLPDFADSRARQALPLLDDFACEFVNAELSPWFYYGFSSVKEVALVESEAESVGAAPDVRPIGIVECLRRVICSALISQHKSVLAEHLWPQQVAIGIPSGISILLYGLRLALELNPHWVAVKVDIRNACNEISGRKVLDRLNAQHHLCTLVLCLWATYSPEAPILLLGSADSLADSPSAEGMQQGDGLASTGFCVCIYPEVCQLDAAVAMHGGAARFDMDDGYVAGLLEAVFPAVEQFAAQVQALGLDLQVCKCECFSPACDLQNHPLRPPAMPLGMLSGRPNGALLGRGIPIAGVPVGGPGFVHEYLRLKASQTMSKIETVTIKLRDLHTQSLYCVTHYCLAPMFQYWTWHNYPTDVREHAQSVDRAVLATVTLCVGTGILDDDVALQRLPLPARRYGGGIRSLADVAPAAFVRTLCRVAPFVADRRDGDWNSIPGFLNCLAGVLPAELFQPDALALAHARTWRGQWLVQLPWHQ